MRILGVLLILTGLGLGIIWPWAQLNLLGNEKANLKFGSLAGSQPEQQEVTLTRADNPVRMRFRASYKVGGKLPPLKIPVKVVITDAEGTLLNGVISFPTDGIEQGPEQPKARGSRPLEFNILNDGPHIVYLQLLDNANSGGIAKPDIENISLTVITNAPEVRDDFKAVSAVLALAGFYLMVRSRRRSKKDRHASRAATTRKWGRGD
jgi:hypothetical protein